MKNVLLLMLLTVVVNLVGCMPSYVPPKNYQLDNNVVIEKNYEQTWKKAVEWFSINNISINAFEKASGLISANRTNVSSLYLDCGSQSYTKVVDSNAKFSVFVEDMSGKSRVRLTLAGQGAFSTVNGFGDPIGIPVWHECVSTGKFESEFFQYLKN